MKITFLLPHIKISGGVRIALNYAHFLNKKGHNVTVVTSSKNFLRRWSANIFNKKPTWFKDINVKILRVKNFQQANIPDADIVVANSWKTAEALKAYSRSKGAQLHLIMHDERLYHGDPIKVSQVYKRKIEKIVISSWLKEMVKKDFKQDANLLITPVDFKIFYPVNVKRNQQEIRILMLHHTYRWKGVDSGIKAFWEVKKKHSNIKLVLYGVRSKNPNVFCDEYYYNIPQNKLAELYSSCDIYLCPSEWEGLGMPGMEAMACRTALVTYDTGGSRDYAFNGRTAFVAEHANLKDLINKLELAVKDNALRVQIAQNGYNFIHKLDTWQKSVDKLEKIMKNFLNKK